MFHIYCKGNNHSSPICDDCKEQLAYSLNKLDICPFAEKKGSCKDCTIHCYKEPERSKIREVMAYAGPRMLFRHPVSAIRHIRDGKWRS